MKKSEKRGMKAQAMFDFSLYNVFDRHDRMCVIEKHGILRELS